jgi:hypothetical protein
MCAAPSAQLPDIPTMEEVGFQGLLSRAALRADRASRNPGSVLRKLNQSLKSSELDADDVKER